MGFFWKLRSPHSRSQGPFARLHKLASEASGPRQGSQVREKEGPGLGSGNAHWVIPLTGSFLSQCSYLVPLSHQIAHLSFDKLICEPRGLEMIAQLLRASGHVRSTEKARRGWVGFCCSNFGLLSRSLMSAESSLRGSCPLIAGPHTAHSALCCVRKRLHKPLVRVVFLPW